MYRRVVGHRYITIYSGISSSRDKKASYTRTDADGSDGSVFLHSQN